MSEVLRHTIGETAKMVGVSAATLRLWEQVGFIKPQRTTSGHRLFDDEDIRQLHRITFLRKQHGLNFAAIRLELGGQEPPKSTTPPVPVIDNAQELGRKLRFYRKKQRFTLKQVSKKSGLSLSFISAVERGATGISLASLLKLSLAYNIHLSDLYGEAPSSDHKLVRATDRQVFDQDLNGVRIEQLTRSPSLMEAQRFILEPGANSEGSYSHEGEELIYVMDGCVDFYLGESEHHHLDVGDCLYFSSLLSHRWENCGSTRADLLWVATSPPLELGKRNRQLPIGDKPKRLPKDQPAKHETSRLQCLHDFTEVLSSEAAGLPTCQAQRGELKRAGYQGRRLPKGSH